MNQFPNPSFSRQDTITISAQAPAAAASLSVQAPAADQAVSAAEAVTVTILPTDSVQVKLEKLRQIDEASDYTGMSYLDIYTTIWERYNDVFDGKMEAITSCLIGGSDWIDINNQYGDEISHRAYYPMKHAAERGEYTGPTDLHSQMLGYGEMSWVEKEAAIKEKYRGKNTLTDFLSMQGELERTGVIEHKLGPSGQFHYRAVLEIQLYKTCSPDKFDRGEPLVQADIDAIADQPFDMKTFFKELKTLLANTTFSGPMAFNMEALISQEIDDLLSALE